MFSTFQSRVLVFFLLFLVNTSTILAQDILSFEKKKSVIDNGIKEVVLATDSVTFRHEACFNGKMHFPVTNQYYHPYLAENRWVEGSLEYQGEIFYLKLMKYDIETDYLIVLPYNTSKAYPVALERNFISNFNLAGRFFNYYKDIDLSVGRIPDGYLEVIHDDKTKLLLKWQKEEVINNSLRQIEYKQRLFMLLWKDGKYHRIRNRLGLVYILRDKRKEVKQFIRKNHLIINRNNYTAISQVLNYYDNL